MKKILNCLIVDDESLARSLLKDLIVQQVDLKCVGECKSVQELQSRLKTRDKIDIVFLDVQMPGISGIQYLQQAEVQFEVVLTTAFPEYAIVSYELEVLDYLLKPITERRFITAVEKAKEIIRLKQQALAYQVEVDSMYKGALNVRFNGTLQKIPFDAILFIEAQGEYIRYHTTAGHYMAIGSLKKINLPDHLFIQVHRAYIIPIQKIKTRIKYTLILVNGVKVPIGKTYRSKVLAALR